MAKGKNWQSENFEEIMAERAKLWHEEVMRRVKVLRTKYKNEKPNR